MDAKDDSTVTEKLSVVLTSFGFSVAVFFLATIVLVPITGTLFNQLGIPELVTKVIILFEMFALPIVAAVYGIQLAARPIIARRFRPSSQN